MTIDEIIQICKGGWSLPGRYQAERELSELGDRAEENDPKAKPPWSDNLLQDAQELCVKTPAARRRHPEIEKRFRRMAEVANS